MHSGLGVPVGRPKARQLELADNGLDARAACQRYEIFPADITDKSSDQPDGPKLEDVISFRLCRPIISMDVCGK